MQVLSEKNSAAQRQDASINTSVVAFSREASLVKPSLFVTENSPVPSPVKMSDSDGKIPAGAHTHASNHDGSFEPSISALQRNSFKLDAEHSSFHSDAPVDLPRCRGERDRETQTQRE